MIIFPIVLWVIVSLLTSGIHFYMVYKKFSLSLQEYEKQCAEYFSTAFIIYLLLYASIIGTIYWIRS